MSYTGAFFPEWGQELYDIAALQSIYGANMNHATGDDVYDSSYWRGSFDVVDSIWDAGGVDTIDASDQITGASFDLRPGGFNFLGNGALSIAFGVEIENAIGTQVMATWIEHNNGSEFRRENAFVEPVNDEKGKPVNILHKVGKRPIIAVGNSEGDRDMLEYSDDKNPATPDLQMIVNHDDPEREYEYAVENQGNRHRINAESG